MVTTWKEGFCVLLALILGLIWDSTLLKLQILSYLLILVFMPWKWIFEQAGKTFDDLSVYWVKLRMLQGETVTKEMKTW